MAGWQDYIDNLIGSSNMTQAFIAGLDGSKWAESPGCDVTVAELQVLAAGFLDPKTIYGKTITLSEVNYQVVRAEGTHIRGKNSNGGGVAASKCNACIVVGMSKAGQNLGLCADDVAKMARYLTEQSY